MLNATLPFFHENMKSRRRGISWDSFCLRNFFKSLDMNFISIKKHETKMLYIESISLFSGKAIPITNQHTDTHPCIRYHIQDFQGILGRIFTICQCPSLPTKLKVLDFPNVEICGHIIFKKDLGFVLAFLKYFHISWTVQVLGNIWDVPKTSRNILPSVPRLQ